MAFNKDSNGFTFGFAIAMVILVGASLAFADLSLKPLQDKNESDKKMINILSAVGIEATRDNAAQKFDEFVTERITLNFAGDVLNASTGTIDKLNPEDAFNIDVKKEYKSGISKLVQSYKNDKVKLMEEVAKIDTKYPLFKVEKEGENYYVIPTVGTGLWGPIWGFVALEKDYNTVYGATFNHKTETPGLGAEIKEELFQAQFPGKTIDDAQGNYVSIVVKKGGATEKNIDHEVDAITGGTITSNGVTEMLYRTIFIYKNYFNKQS